MIPFAPWEPDKGPYSGVSTDYVLNAFPTTNGWRNVPSFVAESSVLAGASIGAWYEQTTLGTYRVIAGWSDGLYVLNTSTTPFSWTDITKAGGYTAQQWNFRQFGTKLIAVDIGTATQVRDVDSGGAFADLAGTPPQAKYIETVGDFVVLAHTDDSPRRLQWSGQNAETMWTPGRQSSDYQIFPDGGEIMGIISVPGGARVFQRNAIRRMVFNPGSGLIFTFDQLTNRGVVAPQSIVSIGNGDYVYLAGDGFFRGDSQTPIGSERVNRYFFDHMDPSYLPSVQGAADHQNKIVWFQYRANTLQFYLIGYNWQLDRWTHGLFWPASSPYFLIDTSTPKIGRGLESLDSEGTLDSLPYSLDSIVWGGTYPVFAALDENYKFGRFTGASYTATLRTQFVELVPGRRAFVQGFRMFNELGSSDRTFAGRVDTLDFAGSAITAGTAATSSAVTGLSPQRASGRFHRFEGALGDGWKLAHGVDVEFREEGRR